MPLWRQICCFPLSLFGSCRSCVALRFVQGSSMIGPDAPEKTGLHPGLTVSSPVSLPVNMEHLWTGWPRAEQHSHTRGWILLSSSFGMLFSPWTWPKNALKEEEQRNVSRWSMKSETDSTEWLKLFKAVNQLSLYYTWVITSSYYISF